jgi:ubiquinone/menaquinone biosynthesis C-methylase UbiE
MVAVARQRNARWIRQGRVNLQQGTVTALPFADDSFDSAFSIHTVYFWPDTQQAFHEIWRVLTPGGHLLITFMPGTLTPPATSLEVTAREQQMMADMEQVGFRQISRRSGPPSRHFATAAIIGIK